MASISESPFFFSYSAISSFFMLEAFFLRSSGRQLLMLKINFVKIEFDQIYSLNSPLFYVVSGLNLHLVGRQDFCSVFRNGVGSFQDCLLRLLVEHLQLFWVPGVQKSITNALRKETYSFVMVSSL